MSNSYYNADGTPGTGASVASAPMRGEFSAIAAGFDLFPTLSIGTASKAVIVNPGGTALTTTIGTLALAGNFAITGSFATTLIAGATVSLTLPLTSGALLVDGGPLGTPASGTLTNCTGTASGLSVGHATTADSATTATTAGSATSAGTATLAASATALATARAIYGNNFDGTAALAQVIASTYGGTGNGFTKFSGPAASEKTFTLPNASSTVLTDNAVVTVAQGGTGLGTLTANNVILGNGTSTPQFVAPGLSGNALVSNGTTWSSGAVAGGSLVWLATLTASSSATLDDTTHITSTYDDYMIVLENIIPATDNSALYMQVSIAASFKSDANYTWSDSVNIFTGQTQIILYSGISNTTASGGVSGQLLLIKPSGTASYKRINSYCSGATSGGNDLSIIRNGKYVGSTGAVDGIRFLQNTGNIASGKIHIYGIKTS